jgi:type VI secretion system secreted protein VgrG
MSVQLQYTQTGRFLKIYTPLGDDALLLTDVQGADRISTPFLFQIQFATLLPDAAVFKLLGQPATIWMACGMDETGRPVNGLIRKLSGPVPNLRGFKFWRAELVPQLAFLGYSADCRIFQNMSVPQIVAAVLEGHNLLNFEFRGLQGSYPALEYCVQYRETALNFCARLLEEVGLYYWHEHADGAHELVISDNFLAAKAAVAETLVMTDQDQYAPVKFMRTDFSFRPGTWTLKDYNFAVPAAPLQYSAPTVIPAPPMSSYEIFDYPGRYANAAEGTDLSRVRVEQEDSQFRRLRGNGTVAYFDTGFLAAVALPDGDGSHDEQEFLLVEVQHQANDMSLLTTDAPPPAYENEFVVAPTDVPFRPERLARKPFVQGPQTAVITGPAGEQIYTDNYGRVKVRFHWDRNPGGDADQNSSCWLRVSQFWASGIGGAIQIPRVGEEVIVNFLEGDPDRPIITGRVYNGENQVIYPMPANKTQAGIKTQSIPSGGFNELRFEDKAGVEQIYVHAQKNFDRVVVNDETATIGRNETRQVTGNLTETVQGNVAETIGGNQTNQITGNLNETITGNETRAVTGNFTEHVTGNVSESVTGNQTNSIQGNYSESITGNESKSVTGNVSEMVTGNFMQNVVGTFMLNAPAVMISTPSMMVSTPASSTSAVGVAINMFGVQMEMNGAKLETTGIASTMTGIKSEGVGLKMGEFGFWRIRAEDIYINDGAGPNLKTWKQAAQGIKATATTPAIPAAPAGGAALGAAGVALGTAGAALGTGAGKKNN